MPKIVITLASSNLRLQKVFSVFEKAAGEGFVSIPGSGYHGRESNSRVKKIGYN